MNSIAAVDIGGTKALAVLAEIDDTGKPRVVASGLAPCKGIKRGSVVDIEETVRAITEAVQKAEAMSGRKITSVSIGVTGEHLDSRPSKGLVPILNPGRTITREDINRVLNHSKQIGLEGDRELLLALPRGFRVDGNDGVRKPFGMSGERLEVDSVLITGLSTHLDNLEKCFRKANLEVETIVPQAHATGIAVAKQEEKDRGVVVIDIGGSTTDIAVYADGSLLSIGMIPIGSQHITNDISILLKTSFEDAERIKRESGTCHTDAVGEDESVDILQVGSEARRPFSRKVLAEIIASRVREILKLAHESIEKQIPFNRLRAGVILTGGGSLLEGIAAFAEKTFGGAAVRVGNPKKLAGLGDTLSNPESATAIGLIQYALKTREEESVTAEGGDWKKVFKSIGSIFSGKSREESR